MCPSSVLPFDAGDSKICYVGGFVMYYAKEALRLHGEWKGKSEVKATVPVETKDDLSLA